MPKGDRENLKADCDDGYTRIANLILEALAMARLNGVQKGICMFLFRRTYGWNRSEDAIALSEFAEACGSGRSYISRQISALIRKNIVCRVAYQPGKTPVYSFITRIADWDRGCININALSQNAVHGLYDCNLQGLNECAIQGLHKTTTAGLHECEGVEQLSDQDQPNITGNRKTERKTLKEREIYSPDSPAYKLAELLLNKILEHLPGYKRPDLKKWAWQMDAAMRLDHRPPEEVKAVILFAQGDTFWRTNILSVDKLRKQYDQLNSRRLQIQAAPGKKLRSDANMMEEEADEYKGFFQ